MIRNSVFGACPNAKIVPTAKTAGARIWKGSLSESMSG
jgi:hypothetical protein